MKTGKVYLVGAGPGHPELLTVKAYKLIGQADVIVYDRLVQEECIAHARKDAERIYMGKASGRHESRQSEINDLLARRALAGNMVVRLKGGDALLFSRGGEEAEYLAKMGIPFEFVPGVTSALAAPAAAGIPVTHRDISNSFCIITGHERDDQQRPLKHDWSALAKIDTLAVLMGVKNLRKITSQLISNGKSPETPAVLVESAYWSTEKILFSTLGKISEDAQREGIEPPAVLLIGEVVGIKQRLVQVDRDLKIESGIKPGMHKGRTIGTAMLYPINLALEGARVLMVGGGDVAFRRIERLLLAGAKVTVVSPKLSDNIREIYEKGAIKVFERPFTPSDLDGMMLAFAATDDFGVNRLVAQEARKRGILVNVADDPLSCDFTLPACVIRGPLVLSVATNARSPGLSAVVRKHLENLFGEEWGLFAQAISDARPDMLAKGINAVEATRRIRNAMNSEALLLFREGRVEQARKLVFSYLLDEDR